jgi:hypothetical protein
VTKPSRWILTVILLASAMWVTAIYWGSHSEGFRFLEAKIRVSREIQGLVGNVRKVTLPALGQYREKFVNSDRWVKMTVDVEGDKGTVTVNTILQKENGVWRITESSIGSRPVDLN